MDDDTALLRVAAAIAAASVPPRSVCRGDGGPVEYVRVNEDGSISVPPGRYVFERPLELPAGVRLV